MHSLRASVRAPRFVVAAKRLTARIPRYGFWYMLVRIRRAYAPLNSFREATSIAEVILAISGVVVAKFSSGQFELYSALGSVGYTSTGGQGPHQAGWKAAARTTCAN